MIEAVIIDFDDTLCLTEAASFALENEALAQMGRPAMSREIHKQTWGQPLFDIIAVRSPGVDAKLFEVILKPILAEYAQNGKLDDIPQANYDALDKLLAAGKLIAVLTSRTHGELKHLLEPDHLLASRVKAFYYKDNTQFHKPDPRAFNEVLAHTGIDPKNCVYVGDSVSDAIASNKAGLRFIASLESGLRQPQDFADVSVDAYVKKFPEIVEAIAGLEARS